MNPFSGRKYIIAGLIVLLLATFVVKLFLLQISDVSYKISAENNSRRIVTVYPTRGLVFDRNGVLLIGNQRSFDLMVIPSQVKSLDTTEFCRLFNVDSDFIISFFRKYKGGLRPQVFLSQISKEDYAIIEDQLHKFPDFYIQERSVRKYETSGAAHVLGYVGEVDSAKIRSDNYYSIGDYIGVSGLEKTYEKQLRGEKGKIIYLVDVHVRIKENYAGGEYDEQAVAGKDLISSIDIQLQEYGERLMKNKKGAIVAIEPVTGEILAIISSPTYDPNLLVGRARSRNYLELDRNDSLRPLFNRAIQSSKNPPGSTFKMVMGLTGLQEGVILPHSTFGCSGGYVVGNFKLGCHNHASPLDLTRAVQNSCNAYFCNVFRKVIDNPKYKSVEKGFIAWQNHIKSFGLGVNLEIDLPYSERDKGQIGDTAYYNRKHGKGRWKSLNFISLAIGQGEVGVNTLQLANMTAAIANNGYYYIPHIIREISGDETIDKKYYKKQFTSISKEHFQPIIDGMYLAVNGGAGSTAGLAIIEDIDLCGKTGTAQNPQGENHSVFVAFAPKDNPKIAIAVFIENAGYGGTWAAPMASLIVEKYLKGYIPENRKWLETRVLEADFINKK
ncbi:MAG: penicillin-binding protein 2 [Bacteroidales bacterium]|nr:penicillin-binding protein 2 [Bacteroidales bacterium]